MQTQDSHPLEKVLAFKYQSGSWLDYTIDNEKLVLELRKIIDMGTLIDLTAFNLFNYITDKIDREHLHKTGDFYNEIEKLEHLVGRTEKKKHYDIKTH